MIINGKNQNEIVIVVQSDSHIDLSEYFDSMPFSLFRSGADLLAVTVDETKIYRLVDFYKYTSDSDILIRLVGFEGQDLMEYAANAPSIDRYQPVFDSATENLPFTPMPIGTVLNFGENSAVSGRLLGYTNFNILGGSANLSFSGHSLSTGLAEEENNMPTIDNASNAVIEDTNILASGILVASDADSDAVLTYNKQNDGLYGHLTIDPTTGAYNYNLDNELDIVQSLNVGETITDVITIFVTDENGAKATSTLTITITGTNDAPTLAVATNEVTEGTITDVTGTLVGGDIDNNAILNYSTDNNGSYGNLTINSETGEYVYSLDNNNADVLALSAGESITDVITVYVTDEHGAQTSSTITIIINGYNEPPTLEPAMGAVIEDTSLTTSGTLVGADIDHNAVLTYGTENNGSYGSLTVNSSTGEYIYTLNNTNIAVDKLDEGDVITDVVTIIVTDEHGAQTTSTLTITITGTNDTPIVDAGAVSAGAVKEDETLTATGNLSFSDVDADDNLSYAVSTASYGNLTYDDISGEWTYALNNNLDAIQHLNAGETIIETITITATDTHSAIVTQTITITITGTNDVPALGAYSNSLTEDTDVTSGNLVATGTLTGTDVDTKATLNYWTDCTCTSTTG
ncbi:MAG: VCBS domain-containing protein [Alphaproteobacteria bacterium]